MKFRFLPFFLLMLMAALQGCGDGTVYEGTKDFDDLVLKYSDPAVYEFTIEGEETHRYKIVAELTYYDKLGRDNIPMYLILEGGDSDSPDFEHTIQLQEAGEWRGELLDNGEDRVITETVVESTEMAPGNYKLKVFSNDSTDKEMFGIVSLKLKVVKLKES